MSTAAIAVHLEEGSSASGANTRICVTIFPVSVLDGSRVLPRWGNDRNTIFNFNFCVFRLHVEKPSYEDLIACSTDLTCTFQVVLPE